MVLIELEIYNKDKDWVNLVSDGWNIAACLSQNQTCNLLVGAVIRVN